VSQHCTFPRCQLRPRKRRQSANDRSMHRHLSRSRDFPLTNQQDFRSLAPQRVNGLQV
jgi:hypothetical protein